MADVAALPAEAYPLVLLGRRWSKIPRCLRKEIYATLGSTQTLQSKFIGPDTPAGFTRAVAVSWNDSGSQPHVHYGDWTANVHPLAQIFKDNLSHAWWRDIDYMDLVRSKPLGPGLPMITQTFRVTWDNKTTCIRFYYQGWHPDDHPLQRALNDAMYVNLFTDEISYRMTTLRTGILQEPEVWLEVERKLDWEKDNTVIQRHIRCTPQHPVAAMFHRETSKAFRGVLIGNWYICGRGEVYRQGTTKLREHLRRKLHY